MNSSFIHYLYSLLANLLFVSDILTLVSFEIILYWYSIFKVSLFIFVSILITSRCIIRRCEVSPPIVTTIIIYISSDISFIWIRHLFCLLSEV